MPLLVPCVKCQRQLRVKQDLAGKTVRCPYCDSSVLVPTVASPEGSSAKRNGGPASRTNSPPPRSSHDDLAEDERADVGMISRKLPSEGPLERAFASVGAVLSARRRELGVGAAIVIVLLVLQFGWNSGGGTHPAVQPQVAAANGAAEAAPADTAETSSNAVNGQGAKGALADTTTTDQSENPEPSEKRVQLQPREKPATQKAVPAPASRKPALPKSSPEKSPDGVEAAAGTAASEKTDSEKPSSEDTAKQPAAGSGGAARKSAAPRPTVAHKGTFTVENPPQVGEIVVVRLKDGLHVAKVTSVDLSELRCEVTVIESNAYKTGTIRETKQTETVRFGQLRIPSRPRAARSAEGGTAPGGAM